MVECGGPTVPPVTLSPNDARRLRAAASKARSSVAERNRLIAEANAEGASLREIAECVGLDHTGVRKIILRAKEDGQ